VEEVDGTGRGLETGGDGTGAEEETGPGTGIAVQMAGTRRAEEAGANRRGHGRRLPTNSRTVHNKFKSILGPVNMIICSNSLRAWQ